MRKNILMMGFLMMWGFASKAQCGGEVVTATNWCDNHYATWTVTNPSPGAKYHWYEEVVSGSSTTIEDMGYGPMSDGSYYVSKYRYEVPVPTPTVTDWDKRTAIYVKEYPVSSFIPSATNVPTNQGIDKFEMTLNTTQRITIHSLTVPVMLHDLNKTYSVSISIGSQTTAAYSFPGASSTPIGASTSNRLVKIPVDITVLGGTNTTISVVSTGANAVNGFVYFPNSTPHDAAFAGNGFTAQGASVSAYSISSRSVFLDWDYTTQCGALTTPGSKNTTTGCCTPVMQVELLSASEPSIVPFVDNSLLLLASVESLSNYFQWYKDGVMMAGNGGVGLTSISVNEPGVYTAREVKNMADLNKVSCYAEGRTVIQERKLFAEQVGTIAASYCLGGIAEIKATGSNISSVSWEPASLVASPQSKQTKVSLGQTGNLNFTVTAKVFANNLITNGTFDGTGGFTSGFALAGSGKIDDGKYRLVTAVPAENDYWLTESPATATSQPRGEGTFMCVGNAGTAGASVWKQTVTVQPNEAYMFSFSHANVSWDGQTSQTNRTAAPDAVLEVFINGVPVGSYTTDGQLKPDGVGRWKTDTLTWKSTSNTSATIEIRQKNAPGYGFGFAIDNILFDIPTTQSAVVTISNIKDCYKVIAEFVNCDPTTGLATLTAKAIDTVSKKEVGVVEKWTIGTTTSPTTVGTTKTIEHTPPQANTLYTVHARFPAGNLIKNNDYELGVNGFNYGSTNGLMDAHSGFGGATGKFQVLGSGVSGCGQWCAELADHTSGTGKMLFVDPGDPDFNVISYDFTTKAGNAHVLSLWIANAVNYTENPTPLLPSISFIINKQGSSTHDTLATVDVTTGNDWHEISSAWTAPSAGDYTLTVFVRGDIYLKTKQPHPAGGGNDFVIDDIKLSTALDSVYTGTVKASPCVSCAMPDSMYLTGITSDTIRLCPSSTSVMLRTSSQVANADTMKRMQYRWYRNSFNNPDSIVKGETTKVYGASDTYTVMRSKPGKYYVVVFDSTDAGYGSCYWTDSIVVDTVAAPSYTITKDTAFCSSSTVKPKVVIHFESGQQPYTFTWSDGTTPTTVTKHDSTGYVIASTWPSTDTANLTKTYSLTALSDSNGCAASTPTSIKATVTRVMKPSYTWDVTTDTIFCKGDSTGVSLNAISTQKGINYKWVKLGVTSNVTLPSTTLTLPTSDVSAGTFRLVASNTARGIVCRDSARDRVITRFATPTYTISGGGTACQGETTDSVCIKVKNGNPVYTIKYSIGGLSFSTTAPGSTDSVNFVVPSMLEGKYTVTSITDTNGCTALIDNSKSATVTLSDTPSVSRNAAIEVCQGDTSVSLKRLFSLGGSAAASATYACTNDSTAIANSKFTRTNSAGTYTVLLTYTDSSCTSHTSNTITVFSKPEIDSLHDDSVCVGTNLDLRARVKAGTGSGAFAYLWTMADATGKPSTATISHLSNLTSATATFSSNSITSQRYAIQVSDVHNCKDTASVLAAATGKPVVTLVADSATLCQDPRSTINLSARIAGTLYRTGEKGTWSNNVTKVLDTTAALSAATATSSPLTATYAYADGNGCSDTATIVLTVNPKPTAAVSVDSSNVCLNSGGKTIAVSPARNSVSSIQVDGATIMGNTFDPFTAGASDTAHVIRYLYTDPNGCKDTATFEVKVHPMPTLGYTPGDTICSDGQESNIVISALPANGTGTFAGTGVRKILDTTATFDPTAATKMAGKEGNDTVIVTYRYVSPGGCAAQLTVAINVFNTPEPADITASDLSTSKRLIPFKQEDQQFSNLRWYATSTRGTSTDSTGRTYTPPIARTADDKKYVSGYFDFCYTQTIHGCQSQCGTATYTVNDCPAEAPTEETAPGKCFDSSGVTTTFEATPANGETLRWFASSTGVTKDSNPLKTGSDFTITVTYPCDTSFWVYPYDETLMCLGVPTKVTRTVYPSPVAIIDTSVHSHYCYYDNVTLKGYELRNIPGNGVFTDAAGTPITSIIPDGTASQALTVTYTYTTTPGSCTDTAMRLIKIHFVEPPTTTPASKVIGIGTLDPIVATPSPTTNTIKWYSIASPRQFLSNDSRYVSTATEPSTDDVHYFQATQVNQYGCESQPDTTTITYTSCGAKAPQVTDEEICTYDELPTFTLSRGAGTTNTHPTIFKIFNTNPGTDMRVATHDTTVVENYKPSLTTPLVKKVIQYWVAEYDSADRCTGPATQFSLTIKSTDTLGSVPIYEFCEATTLTSHDVKFNTDRKITNASIYWYNDSVTSQAVARTSSNIGTSDILTYSNGGSPIAAGTYTFKVSQVSDGCQSPKVRVSFVINPKPVPPAVAGSWSCAGLAYSALSASATPSSGNLLKWYYASDITDSIGFGASFTPDTITARYTRFASTQTTPKGCTSDTAGVTYERRPLPTLSISMGATDTTALCNDHPSKNFTIISEGSDSSSVTIGGANLTPPFAFDPSMYAAGKYQVILSHSHNGCTNKDTTYVRVNPLPAISLGGASFCYDGGLQTVQITRPSGSRALLSGLGAIDSTGFDPSFAGMVDTSSVLQLVVTDASGCDDTATAIMKVTYADAPVAVIIDPYLDSELATNPSIGVACVSKGNGSGNTIEWYDTLPIAPGVKIAAASDSCYNPGLTLAGTDNLFYVTQTENGCKSQPTAVRYQVTSCPWEKPAVTGVSLCHDSLAMDISLEAKLPATTSGTGITWEWFSTNGLSSTKIRTAFSDTSSLHPALPASSSSIARELYQVRYGKTDTTTGRFCFSPRADIPRNIYPHPKPVFDASVLTDYCWNAGSITLAGKEMNNMPSAGTFFVDGFANPTNIIDLTNTSSDRSIHIRYRLAADSSGCVSDTSMTINVHFVNKPILVSDDSHTEGDYKVIGWGTAHTIESAPFDAANKVVWYRGNNTTFNQYFHEGNSTSDPDGEPVSDDIRSVAARGMEYVSPSLTCYSDTTSAKFVYKTCKAAAPIVENIDVCVYDTIPSFTINRGNSNDHIFKYIVYNIDPNTATSPAIDSTSDAGIYTPTNISTPFSTIEDYFIAEYDATDNCIGLSSPASIIPRIVTKPSAGPFRHNCEGTILQRELTATVKSGNVAYWYDSTANYAAEHPSNWLFIGNKFPYTSNLSRGSHGFYVAQVETFDNGKQCQSEKIPVTFVIDSLPPAPSAFGTSSCQPDNNGQLHATALPNHTLRWYAENVEPDTLPSTSFFNNPWKPKPSTPGLKIYKVVQVSNNTGCMSAADTAMYLYKPQPAIPSFDVASKAICEYDTALPIFSLNNYAGGIVNWQVGNDNSTGTNFTPTNAAMYGTPGAYIPKTHTISVSQLFDGCWSNNATATLVVNPRPAPPTVADLSMCYNDAVPSFTAPAGTRWYTSLADAQAMTNYEVTGSFKPAGVAMPAGPGSETTTFYATVLGASTGCESGPADQEVTLTVHGKPANPGLRRDFFLVCSNEREKADTLAALPGGDRYHWLNVTDPAAERRYLDARGNPLTNDSCAAYDPADTSFGHYTRVDMYITDAHGCASDRVRATYKTSPQLKAPVLATDNTTYCVGLVREKVYDVITRANQFQWSVNGQDVPGATGTSFTFDRQQPGNYAVRMEQSYLFTDPRAQAYPRVCPVPPLEFTQVVAKIPAPRINGDSLICENSSSIPYSITPDDSTHSFTWFVSSNRVNYALTTAKILKDITRYIDYKEPGYDTVIVSEDNGYCLGYDTMIVRVSPHADPLFDHVLPGAGTRVQFFNTTPRPVITDGSLSDTVAFTGFTWRFEEGGAPHPQTAENYEAFAGSRSSNEALRRSYTYGTHLVTLISINEYCVDSVQAEIFVDLAENISEPSAFCPTCPSPDLRSFKPKGFNLATYEFSVYDTWGNLIFFSNKLFNGQPLEGWNGTYDGQVMKSDVYVWKVKATFLDDPEGKDHPYQKFGSVMLLR